MKGLLRKFTGHLPGKLMAFCLAAFMVLSVIIPVQAVEKGEKTGSIQLQLPENQEGLEMILYKVADLKDGKFILSSDFAKSGVSIANLNDSQEAQAAAQDLTAFAKEQNLGGSRAVPDAQGVVNFTGLSPALYLVAQSGGEEMLLVQAALVPIPYLNEKGEEVYDAVISPKYSFPGGAVIVDKVDEDGNPVGQACFVLEQKVFPEEGESVPEGAQTGSEEKGTYYWKEFQADLVTSGKGQIAVTDMPMGDYRLTETQAPDGYVWDAQPVYFSITKPGQVAEISGLYQQKSGEVAQVTVVNRQTVVRFNKVDEDGSPVSGAKLVLKDAQGNVIMDESGNAKYVFTSGSTPYELKRLPAGNYFLCEVETPDGYQVSKDVPLTVSSTDPSMVEVTMVDERENETQVGLSVTKRLVDEGGELLSTENGTFYVALFADAGLTERISGVKELSYHGNSSSTVSFSNLVPGTAYYISETDAYGNPLDGIDIDNKTVCVPVYYDSVEITPTEQNPDSEFSFDNMFSELPEGYYYVGRLTVTKKTLKGSEEYNTDQVFYAGVFQDAAYTQRIGDVIELDMDGGYETSVEVEVPIGDTEDASATYYVTETDAQGNPLAMDGSAGFKVEVDNTKATFTRADTDKTVTITNRFANETPTVTPSGESDGGGSSNSSSNSSSSSAGVKTGDNTPVGIFVVVLILAVAAIGVIVYKKRK